MSCNNFKEVPCLHSICCTFLNELIDTTNKIQFYYIYFIDVSEGQQNSIFRLSNTNRPICSPVVVNLGVLKVNICNNIHLIGLINGKRVSL